MNKLVRFLFSEKVFPLLAVIIFSYFLAKILMDFGKFGIYFSAGITVFFLVTIFLQFFRKKILICYCLMLVSYFFIPFQQIQELNLLKFMNPLTGLGLILTVLLFYNYKHKFDFVDFCYLLFIFAGLLGLFKAESKLGTMNWLFHSFFTGYIVYKTILSLSDIEVDAIITCLIGFSLITFSYGMLFYLTGINNVVLSSISGRLSSLLGHPLTNAFVFGIVFFYTLGQYQKKKRNIYLVFAFCLLIAIVFTKSRGALFSLLIIFAISIFRNRINYKYLSFFTMIFLVLTVTPIKDVILNRLTTNESSKHSSWNIRLESLKIGTQMFKKNPFVGVGLFNSRRFKKDFTTDAVIGRTTFENSLLEIFIETGILGALPFFLIILFILNRAFFSRIPNSFFYFSACFFMIIDAATFNILSINRSAHFIFWSVIAITRKKTEIV